MKLKRETFWMAIGAILAAIVLALGFRAYLHPDLVIELTSLLLCT